MKDTRCSVSGVHNLYKYVIVASFFEVSDLCNFVIVMHLVKKHLLVIRGATTL